MLARCVGRSFTAARMPPTWNSADLARCPTASANGAKAVGYGSSCVPTLQRLMASEPRAKAEVCNCLALREATRHVTQFYDRVLDPGQVAAGGGNDDQRARQKLGHGSHNARPQHPAA